MATAASERREAKEGNGKCRNTVLVVDWRERVREIERGQKALTKEKREEILQEIEVKRKEYKDQMREEKL